jgi:hypothetical protein
MKIYIKNMVAQGTRKYVLTELKKLGLKLISFESGELEFENDLSFEQGSALEISLRKYGLELILSNYDSDLRFAMYTQDKAFIYEEDILETAGSAQLAEMSQP